MRATFVATITLIFAACGVGAEGFGGQPPSDADIDSTLSLSIEDRRTGLLKQETVAHLLKRIFPGKPPIQRSGVIFGDHYEALNFTIAIPGSNEGSYTLELLTLTTDGRDLAARRVLNARLIYTSPSGVPYYNQIVDAPWPIESAAR